MSREEIRKRTNEFIRYLLSTEEFKKIKADAQAIGHMNREIDVVFDFRSYDFFRNHDTYPIDRLLLFQNWYGNPEGTERVVTE